MKVFLSICIAIGFTFCLFSICLGQILPFHYYTTKDGLPSNDVRALYQDSRGFVWIGTAEGLSLYDGNTFTNYNRSNGLASDFVTDVIEDRTSPGTMWIATNGGGVDKFSDGNFSIFHLGSRRVSDFVEIVMQDRLGVLWCGSDSGVFRIQNNIVTEFHHEAGFWAVNSIVESNDSTVWIASGSNLFCYSRSSDKLDVIDIQEPEQRAERMCKDALGDLWVTTHEGDILQIRGKKILRRCHSGLHKTPGYDTFYSLHDDGKGQLWASTWSGLFKISKDHLSRDKIVQYTSENGLPENQLFTFLIDHEENYWIGTHTRGVAKLTEKSVYKFSFPGFTFNGINNSSGTGDRFGRIWLVASRGIWETWRDDQDRWHTFFHRLLDERSQSSLYNIVCDSQDQIWIAGSSPLTIQCYSIDRQFDRESRLHLKKELQLSRELPAGFVGFILDRRGYLWISSSGVAVVDPSKLPRLKRVLTEADGIPPGSIRALYEDHNGNIWLGGGYGGGIAMVPKGDWNRTIAERYTLQNGLPDDLIRALGEDKNGRLLIGTRFGGLSILDHGQFTTYTTKDGLLSNGILGIARDNLGNIIVGTHLGSQVFNEASSRPFESNNELVGVQAMSSGICPNQDIWLVEQDALFIYEYSKRGRPHFPPPVYITNIAVNGNRVPADGIPELSHDQNNVLLNFVGISFRDERLNRYRYRLLDNDRDWQPLTKQTSVNYAALKSGTYRFEVKAINSDGIESLTSASLSFTILSPFWQGWWFYLLVGASIVGVTILVYQYRVSQLLKMERMRTRIASDLHDDIGASLTRIALFSEVVKEEAEQSSPRLVEMAEKIGMNARELLDSVGTLVWSIDPRHDRFEDVITHLKNFAQEMFSLKGIDYTFTVQEKAHELQLPLEARKNVLLIFKEAVNNIVKHAGARTVSIDLALRNGVFEMSIADNGGGIASTILRPGHGLLNMRARAQNIGGTLDIQAGKGQGTTILLHVPITK